MPSWPKQQPRACGNSSQRGLAIGRLSAMAYLVLLFALLLPSAGNAQGATDGVCGRTQQVRDELVRLAGAGDCASVTADNLAAITNLDLEDKAIASLQASDFAGLTSLVYLRLRNNQLSLDSFPGGLFSSLPLSIRYIEVSGNPGCPSYGNLCFPPAPTIDATVGTDTSGRTVARTDETVKLSSSQGDYRDPLGRSLLAAWSQNTGTVVNLATADNGWSAAFTVPHVTADEDAEFVVTVTTPVFGRWSATILNNFWEEANTQADLTFAPPLPSSDTSLSELEIYGVTPRYNSSTRIYELTVPNSSATVSVRANPRERNAVVEIIPLDSQPATGHQVDLEPGANSISITVTATDEVTTQTYTVTVTRDESAGVCGRTQQVRDELVRLAGAGDCASVTADNLAAITNLDLENKAIASLQASDFAGLTSLVYLRLRNNQLSLDSFPGGLFSSLPLSIRYIEVSGNPGCPSYGNLCFPPTPTVDVLVGTDEREIAIVRTAETVRLRSGPGDYRDPLGRSLRTAWSQNTGTVVNLAAAYDGWSAAFTVPHVTADEDAEFVVTVTTPVSGRWSATILNNFWEEANTQADLTFSPPDTAAPQVASIARQSPTSSPTRADSLTWRVTFSETVANVDEADFEVGVPTATLTVAAVPGSSVAHDVTVEGGNLAGLTGTVTLAFASDHDIADTAGNALTNTVPTRANDNTFELDNTAPTVTIGGVPETSTAPFTATITFTEPVTGFVLADIALANATAAAFTGADGDRAFTALITPTADGAVTVDVAADVARDAAGNGNAAAAQVSSTYDPNAGICGRTAAVQTAILAKIAGVSDCANVTSDHLAAITGELNLIAESITALAAGDFAGLTALTTLDLSSNALTALPDGMFVDLTALTTLSLENNQLATLPAGVFDGLTALTKLDLNSNGLTALPDGVFVDLTALTGLWLYGNMLTALPAGVFDDLTALTTLNLRNNGLTTLPAGVFAGLTALTTLALEGNPGAPFAPVAVALPDDGTVPVAGGTVRLDGSGSDGGPWGANVEYSWALTTPASGVAVTFDDDASATPMATIPAQAAGTGLVFTLTVTGRGSRHASSTGVASATDTAAVTVTAAMAPGALASLAATARDGRVTLAWTAPSDDGGAPVTGYEYRHRKDSDADWPARWTAVADGSDAGTATDDERMVAVTGLDNGALYRFQVRALNRAGAGAALEAQATPSGAQCSAPDLAGRERVWQGTLTVGRQAGALLRELVGYGWTSRTGALSGRTAPIVLDANRYRIGDFVLLYAHTTNLDVVLGLPAAGTLVFHLVGATDRDAELTAAEKAALALHVCDARFDFSAATRRGEGGAAPPPGPGQDRHYLWENAGLTWSAGLVRTLTLSRPAVSGARAAAAVEGLPELTDPGEDGVYAARDRIEVRVRFDAPVTVDASGGGPTLGLALGGIRREAAYVPGQDGDAATELVFALAVSGEDAGAGAAKAIANGIRLNGATIRDEGGADAVLDYGAAPGVVAVEVGAEPSGDGAWTADEAVEVTLAFAEPVEVGTEGGTPSVGLTLPGAGARRAVYASGSGTDRLFFAYTLTGADGPVSAALVDPDGLAPGGGTIVSTGGLDAVLTHGGAGRTAGPRAPGPVLSVADAEGAEGGTLAFRVTLAPAASGPVTVAYATADGPSANGAVAGEDYTAASGTLAFKPGETEKTVAVAVTGDVPGEGAETLTLALSDATGASIGDGEATGMIGASAGPAALTASFLGVPPEHDGQNPFTVELRFSEEPQGLSYRTVRDSLFAVSGGTLAKARRFEPPANLRYELTLAPSGDGAVTLARAALPACGAPGAVCTGDGRSLSGALALDVPGPAALSVADAQVKEGPDAMLAFAVTLDRARHAAVTVDYATRDGTAVAGADYTNTSGTLTFVAGETRKAVDVQVLADSHDEGSETMTLALSNATGARIADGEATGTIDNSGSIPQAWIARFGRTVAEQVIEAVEGRMRAAPAPGAEVALAGERIGGQPEPGIGADGDASREEEARRDALRLADWRKGETDPEEAARRSRAVTPRDLLTGSSFALTAETAGKDLVSLWGRAAVSRFDGREGDLTLDGEVVTGMLGADWTRGRWTAGLIVSHSVGEGGYSDGSGTGSASGTGPGSASGTGGKVEATLTGLFPWARHALSERLEAWGAAGYGAGELTVTPKEPGTDEDGAAIRADLDLRMAAAGLRGVLLDPGSGSGFQLTGKTDAMVVQTSSGRGKGADGGNMEPARTTVTRLRLGLEASRPFALGPGSGSGAGGGAVLTPSLEIGVRHDGGDAETGFGFDLGGGLALSDPKRGLQAELRGRGLLAHRSKGFRDLGFSGALAWEGKPGSDRGAELRLTQTLGGSSSGGADALLARTTLEGLAANDNGEGGNDELKSRRLELKFGYGLSAFGERFTWTPEIGVGLSDTGRDYSLGWRLVRGGFGGDGGSFELSFEARRRESANDDTPPEHAIGLRLTARW